MSIVITARPLPPPPDMVSALQFITALAVPPAQRPAPFTGTRLTSYITEAEAEAWISRTALPDYALAAIAALPAEQRMPARLAALGMSTTHRLSPLIDTAMTLTQVGNEERDQIFRFAQTLFPNP